jgi:thioredoxin 1
MVQDITDSTFESFTEENPLAVVDCWATWCAPCRFLSPVIEKLAEERKDVAFGKLDVDQNKLVSIKYGIMSVPTLLYFKNGKLVNRTVGALPKQMIEDHISKMTA